MRRPGGLSPRPPEGENRGIFHGKRRGRQRDHPRGGGRADPEVRDHAGVTKISTCRL